MTIDTADVNGAEPPIVGLVCQSLVAIEYSYAGHVVEPANVVFLRFADQWHRLYFDCGIVFWRLSEDGPNAPANNENDAGYRPVDLGARFDVQDRRLQRIVTSVISNGSQVTLEFEEHRVVAFSCIDDVTSYA